MFTGNIIAELGTSLFSPYYRCMAKFVRAEVFPYIVDNDLPGTVWLDDYDNLRYNWWNHMNVYKHMPTINKLIADTMAKHKQW